ncbi:hypothetical protein [Neolewinella antarctica]|uniref:Secreted protein n=1 Tax=Neolewinella antarctica TaxID=442734 RepID=A0ABX0XA83_9BACT|nr:hypothetical protein [Neolewinella antarctica]NJC25697.1 hypothetical protein [Neolewinella antarctica]
MKFLAPLLLLAFLAFSCGDTTRTAANNPGTDMTDAEPTGDVKATIDAVQSTGGDITALPAAAAVSNIDGWISTLGAMNGTDGIVRDLQSLKTELSAGAIDGDRVSGLLSSLATSTRSMESKAAGLGTLASALQAGADKLSGM